MRVFNLSIILLGVLYSPSLALAAFKDRTPVSLDEKPAAAPESPSHLKGVVGFLLILLLIYALFRFLKHIQNQSEMGITNSPAVEIISRTPLSKDGYLVVARAGERILVLSQTPHHTRLLRDLSLTEASVEGLDKSIANPIKENWKAWIVKRKAKGPATAPTVGELLRREGE